MIETYRIHPLNMRNVFENLVKGIKNYFERNNLKVAVLGLSGGLDSTVVAALCKASGIPTIGVSLPCSTNKDDEKSAASTAGHEFCSDFKEVNLQETFEVVEKFCTNVSGEKSTPISQGNIKARLRMITLYDIASKCGGIVMDTDNLTESFLGFFTIHGDEGDFNPIGGLWKHEVYDLARYMKDSVFKDSKALEASIALVPTDGNGVKEGGDLAQIAPGRTYDDVDDILDSWVELTPTIKEYIIESDFKHGIFPSLSKEYGEDAVKSVAMRSVRSEFKRKHRPFVINIHDGNICEKNGNRIKL